MAPASYPAPGPGPDDGAADMGRALELAASVRTTTSPNPWVGAVLVAGHSRFEGATEAPGGRHAEVVALQAAGDRAEGATLFTTLEPCAHVGRTPPCAEALVRAGVRRVVISVLDSDPQVAGRGAQYLRDHGVSVEVGLGEEATAEVLAPYLKHRRTGRPWVVLKLAATLDGRIAAPDGSSRWLSGEEARADVQRLRAESDAVLVGAATVRRDDPELTVRGESVPERQPLRVVLGHAADDARVHPALQFEGDLEPVLDELGAKGVLQLLVEGGAHVAHAFHQGALVDRYVLYLVPALFGGDDAVPMFAGPGASSMEGLWRGRLLSVLRLGPDVRIELAA
ncbi:MAG TPA: bifunctional diaminohydroxyphosphoribosylaminopyrimidine deaminase/5-amino-6-(5-phosphoribosylamino)uracil reductase RibD [Acidimicrobiales bacterium]|nr:bifunctional diaminohydroxyphosphoribosylaminopyrimidine deaminase/5-amino-6-(5-phosphoribosylamino)uracil reductase RibD [Acidimicrobiales bacterium]